MEDTAGDMVILTGTMIIPPDMTIAIIMNIPIRKDIVIGRITVSGESIGNGIDIEDPETEEPIGDINRYGFSIKIIEPVSVWPISPTILQS